MDLTASKSRVETVKYNRQMEKMILRSECKFISTRYEGCYLQTGNYLQCSRR